MPVPKRKTSKARRDKRSAGQVFKAATVVACQTCQAAVLPHQVCRECGHYKGVKVLRTKSDRMYERSQTRQAQQQPKAEAHMNQPVTKSE